MGMAEFVLSCLVGCSGHDTTFLLGTANNKGPTFVLRVVHLLNRGVKSVEVGVQNVSPILGYHEDILPPNQPEGELGSNIWTFFSYTTVLISHGTDAERNDN
jgi:hypothetical protein